MRRLILLPFLLLIFGTIPFSFIKLRTTHAQSVPSPNYTLEVTSENESLIPLEVKNSISDTLNTRWQGDTPLNNVFYIPSIRWENDWAIADIHYKRNDVDYSNPENSPINTTVSMILAKNPRGVWQSAFSDESQAADIARIIPDDELSYEAKTTLLTHFPSQYKTMALNTVYKLPWSQSGTKFFFSGVRTTNTQPCPNNSGWHGALPYLGGQPCHALDFAPRLSPTITNADILSPVTGYIYQICKNPGSQKQSALAIKATNSNEIIGIWHLDKNTIPSRVKQGELIKQGEFLGQMVTGFVNESKSTCPLVSQGTHIHIVAPYRPFTIDSYTFTPNSKVLYSGSEYSMSSFQNTNMVSTNGTETTSGANCRPPVSGDWVISENCTLTSSASVPNNLVISDGKSLTINSNVTLDMNLRYYKILIKPNAKLLINSGAKII